MGRKATTTIGPFRLQTDTSWVKFDFKQEVECDMRFRFPPIIWVLALIANALLITPAALADYSDAKSQFEKLPPKEQADIVIGLITTGDFSGLIDYGFTRRLYRSLTTFESREGFAADGIVTSAERDRLNNYTQRFFAELGVETVQHPLSGAQLLVPKANFDTSTKTENGFAYERTDNSLSLNLVAYTSSERSFASLYDRFSTNTGTRQVDYKILRERFFVASGTYKGRRFYTWMSKVPTGTTGFTLTWSSDRDALGAKLSILLANSFDINVDRKNPGGEDVDIFSNETVVETKPVEVTSSTGTGFFISSAGHLVTNAHVVDQCKQVRVRLPHNRWTNADIVTKRDDLDLALLTTRERNSGPFAKIRPSSSVRLGEDAIAFGFPLTGALSSDGNLTVGNISSLSGWQNDRTKFQISAPVQPGNSGGPLVDRSGRIIGVVVAKLNAIEVAKVTGDIPQNVNFAIKSDILIGFLDWIGSKYEVTTDEKALSTAEIGTSVQDYTSLVECTR
jgi:serine protease Do